MRYFSAFFGRPPFLLGKSHPAAGFGAKAFTFFGCPNSGTFAASNRVFRRPAAAHRRPLQGFDRTIKPVTLRYH